MATESASLGLLSHDATPAGQDIAASIDALVQNHPAVLEFCQRPHCKESRNIFRIQEEDIPYNLTATTLAGEDMITEKPYVFTDDESGSMLALYYLGSRLAGHSKIVHGGIPAVFLDECMGRACFPKLAGKIGVTAKLDLEYKNPIPVGSVVLVKATTVDVQGRKAWVEASVENARDGKLCVKASGLFIEPKWAADMPPVI